MAFTEFLFDEALIKEAASERAAALKANKGFSDLAGYALGVMERRLTGDPLRYLDYGPYWWALKDELRKSDRDYGDRDDAVVRATYQGATPLLTIVMADEFRTLYLATQAVGTCQFVLDVDAGDAYTLHDEDMHSR